MVGEGAAWRLWKMEMALRLGAQGVCPNCGGRLDENGECPGWYDTGMAEWFELNGIDPDEYKHAGRQLVLPLARRD